MPIQNNSIVMGSGIAATGTGGKVPLSGPNHSFQSVLTDGGGDNVAQVIIQCSNDGTNWVTPVITLDHSDSGTEAGRIVDGTYTWARYNVTDLDAAGGDTLAVICSSSPGIR